MIDKQGIVTQQQALILLQKHCPTYDNRIAKAVPCYDQHAVLTSLLIYLVLFVLMLPVADLLLGQ